MPWHKLPVSQHRALLQKSLPTRRSQILDLAAEVGPVIEAYRAQACGDRARVRPGIPSFRRCG
ncbi:MAG: hypothetical protein OXJ56_10055 [Rhodospirillaceae bacterium]|nr:hypothetical protein [Rhodospirillaceae bacterium]